jgi:hypothetical protein
MILGNSKMSIETASKDVNNRLDNVNDYRHVHLDRLL